MVMITGSKLIIRFVFMYRDLIADPTAVVLSIRDVARTTDRTLSENILWFICVPFIWEMLSSATSNLSRVIPHGSDAFYAHRSNTGS